MRHSSEKSHIVWPWVSKTEENIKRLRAVWNTPWLSEGKQAPVLNLSGSFEKSSRLEHWYFERNVVLNLTLFIYNFNFNDSKITLVGIMPITPVTTAILNCGDTESLLLPFSSWKQYRNDWTYCKYFRSSRNTQRSNIYQFVDIFK